jgi:prephenate dehydrogenase
MSEVASVQVIGAGLMGTSIALGLHDHGIALHVDDRDPDHVRVAVERGAGSAGRAPDPDLVIVAVPPSEVVNSVLEALREWPRAVVTDVASVKLPVAQAVAGRAGADRYVGSHPMSGRERSGPVAASARLCEGNPWVVVPLPETSEQSVRVLESVVELLGAWMPRRMDAATHDRAVALVSHAPQVISALMAARLADAPSTHVELAGPGLRDVTRIAGSDSALWVDILAANAEEVRAVLQDVYTDLGRVVAELDGDGRGIAGILELGRTGTQAIPSKHGDTPVEWATVYVVVPDQPRALEQMIVDAGQSGVNIEDLRIQHELGRMAGIVEISVVPDAASTLIDALVGRGWPAYL